MTPTPSNLPPQTRWLRFRAAGGAGSVAIAFAFCAAVTAILMLRQNVVSYRPGQFVAHDITARVDFEFPDANQLAFLREQARRDEPRVYRATATDYWAALEDQLTLLPDRAAGHALDDLPPDLHGLLDTADLKALAPYQAQQRAQYTQAVQKYLDNLRRHLTVGATGATPLVVLPRSQRQEELNRAGDDSASRAITLYPSQRVNVASATLAASTDLPVDLITQLHSLADPLPAALRPTLVQLTSTYIRRHPTHELDARATEAARDRAADSVLAADALEHFTRNSVIVPREIISERDWQMLRAENLAFLATRDEAWLRMLLGNALIALTITGLLTAYVLHYQPRIVRNHIRGAALAALMTAMLLVSGLAGSGSGPMYFYGFGIAPTVLAALILTIAYDRRFAIGVSCVLAVMVTAALDQGIGFFLILFVGSLVACFMLDDVRTRGKLIEVGGCSALAMMAVTAASGLTSLDSIPYVIQNTLYAGASGMAAGFIALGILPFIERVFHITTSMTLLELADVTHPLLKRLAIEAPGTYSHSLQVATLAEASAEAIGANALACRVGAYYHDIGKVNKPEYFAENQQPGETSRHLNLSPNVSLMIILGHVRDGLEMARQHHLPPVILQFIQQHHGTTLVEFFYKEACRQQAPTDAQLPETEFRYPGPKPKSRETAILMICDCCESACRSMTQPDATRIEKLVHELIMRRLHDGQFDECDMTLRGLTIVERTIVKTLLGIHHGRVAYPSTAAFQNGSPPERKLA